MSILSKVTRKAMWKNRTRTIVTIIGIILSAAMFTAVTTLGYSLWSYMRAIEVYDTGDYFLRLDYATREHIDALAEDDRVSEMTPLGILGYTEFTLQYPDDYTVSEYCAVAAGDADFYDTVNIPLKNGRFPQNCNEIVIPRNVYLYLKEDGRSYEVGDTLTLDIEPKYDAFAGDNPLPAEGEVFSRTYTIVGISESLSMLDDYTLYLNHLFTYTDREDASVWYRIYLKTHDPKDAYALYHEIPEDVSGSVNAGLLQLYGATPYTNFDTMILWVCAVLIAIIMVGSVSLIYNAFSISVSEWTKEFGILGSVGATRKQIRGAVYSEAVLLSAIGIPLGLLSGYAGIAVTLNLLSARIHTMLSTGDGTILLKPVLSLAALGAAAVIALITVLISAAIPARRAAKISPIDAIRQKNDYLVPKKSIRVSKLTGKLFGLPAVLARKYYKVSRKKYRATVISLVISIVLFVSAASVSQLIRFTVDRAVNTENYDMVCYGSREALEDIRQQPFVQDSVFFSEGYYAAFVPDEYLDESYLQCWESLRAHNSSITKNIHDIRLIYLEDTVFKAYLAQQGLPEAPYFSDEIPSALLVAKDVTVYDFSTKNGEAERYTFSYVPYNAEGRELGLFESSLATELTAITHQISGTMTYKYYTDENGNNVVAVIPIISTEEGKMIDDWDRRTEYLILWDEGDTGITASYYLRDIVTGEVAEEPTTVEGLDTPRLKLGATVTELPFGISYYAANGYYYNCLILPLSAAPEEVPYFINLCITASDYVAARTYLQTYLGEMNFIDYKESEEHNRTLLLLINVFSYGFIVLISLICVANVFNTISTNVALRRRDFGMLRSTGFREKDLWKMMQYECLSYGGKAMLWGVPISLAASYLIQHMDNSISSKGFTLPWGALVIAALCVFLVVFVTMSYAVSKLRKDNTIDAIRMETV